MKFAIKRLQALLLCTVICLLSLAGLLSSCAKNPDPLARDRVSSVLLDSKGRVCVEVTLSARSLEQRKGEGLRLYELLPGETFSALSSKEPLATERIAAEVTFRVPLLEDGHSRLYSSYAVFFDDGSALSTSQAYLQNPEALANTSLPFAWQSSPKALAVDDVEAALSLGVMHDVVEISEAELLPLGADRVPDSVLARLDAEIGASSNAGMQVTLRIRTQTESSLHLSKIDGLADLLADRYADRVGDKLTFELDFSTNTSLYSSDLLITDWSGIAPEYCFATKRPALFVNTKIKCLNPNWEKIDCTPVEIELRNKLGRAVDKEALAECDLIVKDLFARADEYEQIIDETLHDHLYNIGTAAEAGADYILQSLVAKKK